MLSVQCTKVQVYKSTSVHWPSQGPTLTKQARLLTQLGKIDKVKLFHLSDIIRMNCLNIFLTLPWAQDGIQNRLVLRDIKE